MGTGCAGHRQQVEQRLLRHAELQALLFMSALLRRVYRCNADLSTIFKRCGLTRRRRASRSSSALAWPQLRPARRLSWKRWPTYDLLRARLLMGTGCVGDPEFWELLALRYAELQALSQCRSRQLQLVHLDSHSVDQSMATTQRGLR